MSPSRIYQSLPQGIAIGHAIQQAVYGYGTTNRTIARDLTASLTAREGVPGGHTLGEYKAALSALGLTDDTRIASIEWGISQSGNGRVILDVTSEGIELREGHS